MQLTPEQREAVFRKLHDSYNQADLEEMLWRRLKRRLDDYASRYKDWPDILTALTQGAAREGWLRELLEAAAAFRPEKAELAEFVADLLTNLAPGEPVEWGAHEALGRQLRAFWIIPITFIVIVGLVAILLIATKGYSVAARPAAPTATATGIPTASVGVLAQKVGEDVAPTRVAAFESNATRPPSSTARPALAAEPASGPGSAEAAPAVLPTSIDTSTTAPVAASVTPTATASPSAIFATAPAASPTEAATPLPPSAPTPAATLTADEVREHWLHFLWTTQLGLLHNPIVDPAIFATAAPGATVTPLSVRDETLLRVYCGDAARGSLLIFSVTVKQYHPTIRSYTALDTNPLPTIEPGGPPCTGICCPVGQWRVEQVERWRLESSQPPVCYRETYKYCLKSISENQFPALCIDSYRVLTPTVVIPCPKSTPSR